MKVYSLYCAYWSAGDWYKWNVLNYSMDPTDSEILGVYMSGSEAIIAMNEQESDPDNTLDLCVYESYDIEEEDIKEYLKENELTLDDIPHLAVNQWLDIATKYKLLRWDIEHRIIDQDTEDLYGDEIIVSWSWYRYVGYAHKFEGIHTADELGFKRETDLATGNEESTLKTNYTIILNHEEVSKLEEGELEFAILDELNRVQWKWTHDSLYIWDVYRKFGTDDEEE